MDFVRIAVEGEDLDYAAGLHTLNEVDHGQDEQSHGQQDPQGI